MDKTLYVFVQNGTQDGFYNVHIDAKTDITIQDLFAESVFVLDEGVEIEADDIQHYLFFDGHVETFHFGEHIVRIGRLSLYFLFPNPEIHFDKALQSIDYFHVSLSWDAMIGKVGDSSRIDLYFGGDCPQMEDGTLYNNGFSGMMLHYHQGAKGFKTFMQSASTICIEEEAYIPDITIEEYVLETNRRAREMAQTLYDRSVETGNDEFLLFPISGLDFYFDLKDFVLELTQDCSSDYERARVIFDWIVDNIEYDMDYLTASVEEVFQDKKAVCAGYSFLYHDMLAAAGIPSFYTGGTVLGEIADDDIETFIRATLDSSQIDAGHGWVYAIIDGEAICCDPTWGDFDMSDEYLSSTRFIFHVDGIKVLYDNRLYPLIRDISVVYCDGEFYFVENGVASGAGECAFSINYVLDLDFQANRNSKSIHGAESFDSALVVPYGAIYHDGLLYYDDPYFLVNTGISLWKYCLCDGKAIEFSLLLRYMKLERERYGTVFEHEFDLGFCSIVDAEVYYEYEPGELMLLTVVDNPSSFTVPISVNGKRVTALGEGCFQKLDGLQEVILPEGLEWMVGSCFAWCTSLTTVRIPSTVTEFGPGMFFKCTALEEVTLPEGLTVISNGTFDFCASLEHIDIPSSVTTIEGLAFGCCYSLADITLPEALETLGEDAFTYCSSLEEVFLPAKVKEIGKAPFGFCPKLTSIVVDPNNPYFDSRNECNAIIRTKTNTLVSACKTVTIPGGIVGLEKYSCCGLLDVDTIVIPSSVTYIGELAFFGCETLVHVDFGAESDLKTIDRYAFYCCYAIEEFVLPEGLETIEDNAFSNCRCLTELVFPSTIQKIGTWIAYDANNLTEATYRGSVESWEMVNKDPQWYYRTSCTVVHCLGGDVALA